VNTSLALTAREVYQLLKDVALGTRTLYRLQAPTGSNSVHVAIDDYTLTLQIDHHRIIHCADCHSSDGRFATLDDWPRLGTDPVELLSAWERRQLEHLML